MNTLQDFPTHDIAIAANVHPSRRLGTIDARKHTLYDVMMNTGLDDFSMAERWAIFHDWQQSMLQYQIAHYQRVALNGCGTERMIMDPATQNVSAVINFASNDYLNMSCHPAVMNAAIEAIAQYGTGAGAACNASGQTKIKQELEREIADTFGYEKALVFSSGYATNTGVLSGLLRSNDVAIVDMLAHASIMDGVENRNKMLFRHNDMASLETVLRRASDRFANKIVVVDGVYSMDGDIANLPEIAALCKKYNALLMVDEAHAFGVIGKHGLGILDHFNMPADSIDILVGTLSKSVGSSGGFVAGSKELIHYLEFAARSYLFSTGPFVASCAAALASIKIIREDTARRQRLWNNIRAFRSMAIVTGFDMGRAETAIIPIILANHNKVLEVTRVMGNNGVLVNGIPYPVVSRKQTRIRMTITSEMTTAHIHQGFCCLTDAIDNYEMF